MRILFNDDAKNSLIEGVNLIGDAVKTTFGPNGKNVIIKGHSGIYITKDGATVARYVESDNPFVQSGIELVKNIAIKTAGDIGDGSTSATILSQALVNKLKDLKESPIEVSRKLEEEVKLVVDYLEKNKKTIESLEDLLKVATISTNNDPDLGRLVAETYYNVTKDGVVNVESSQDVNSSVVYSQGVKLENGFSSPYFINTTKGVCELENVLVSVHNSPLNDIKEITTICEKAIRLKKSILIVAPKIDSTIIRTLVMNKESGVLNSCCVVSQSHGIYSDYLKEDIRTIIGEECDKVIIEKDCTYLIKDKIQNHEDKINELKELLKSNLSEFERVFHRKRLANYIGGIATIYVGGYSEVEIQEKKDRIDDAIGAVRAAMIDGVLPGGGISLFKASVKLNLNYLEEVLRIPLRLLCRSSQFKKEHWLDYNDFWQGANLKNGEVGDMYEMGVIDPFLVTKISLENAVSVASLILTNGCSIVTI